MWVLWIASLCLHRLTRRSAMVCGLRKSRSSKASMPAQQSIGMMYVNRKRAAMWLRGPSHETWVGCGRCGITLHSPRRCHKNCFHKNCFYIGRLSSTQLLLRPARSHVGSRPATTCSCSTHPCRPTRRFWCEQGHQAERHEAPRDLERANGFRAKCRLAWCVYLHSSAVSLCTPSCK